MILQMEADITSFRTLVRSTQLLQQSQGLNHYPKRLQSEYLPLTTVLLYSTKSLAHICAYGMIPVKY